ncbi:hypothetical protein FOZ63_006223, partial [Perkinsus olseni]
PTGRSSVLVNLESSTPVLKMTGGPLPPSGLSGLGSVLGKYTSLEDVCKLPIARTLPTLWKHCTLVDWIGPPTHADIDRPYPEGTLGAVYDPKHGEAGFTARGYFPRVSWSSPEVRLWVREHAMDWLGMQPDEVHHGPAQHGYSSPLAAYTPAGFTQSSFVTGLHHGHAIVVHSIL